LNQLLVILWPRPLTNSELGLHTEDIQSGGIYGQTVGHCRIYTSDHTADSLMAAPIGEEELSKAAIAEEFLREFVTGPVPQDVVVKHAQALDISHGTLQRAKRKLGIVDKRIGFGANGYSMWYPPKDAQPKEVK